MSDLLSALLTLVYGQATLCAIFLGVLYLVLATAALQGARAQRKAALAWERGALYSAASMHCVLLASTVWLPHPGGSVLLGLGFAQVLSLAACVGVLLLCWEERWVGIYALRPVALVLPAIAVLLSALNRPVPALLSQGAAVHVLFAVAAHGLALLACGHALLLWSLTRVLKSGAMQPQAWLARWVNQSPPLVVLEQILIRIAIWIAGLLAMTVGLGAWSGALRLDHKTVLTVASLLGWLAVVWGYERRAWRGKTLCFAVAIATGLLLLAYIGSRFVLQSVLHRI